MLGTLYILDSCMAASSRENTSKVLSVRMWAGRKIMILFKLHFYGLQGVAHGVSLILVSILARHEVYFSLKSATPGRTFAREVHRQSPMEKRTLTFPSNNSRLAPPPVLTWLSLSSAPYCATTVAVSPPPTMTTTPFSAASRLASRRALDPPAKAGNSNTPGGLGFIRG